MSNHDNPLNRYSETLASKIIGYLQAVSPCVGELSTVGTRSVSWKYIDVSSLECKPRLLAAGTSN